MSEVLEDLMKLRQRMATAAYSDSISLADDVEFAVDLILRILIKINDRIGDL